MERYSKGQFSKIRHISKEVCRILHLWTQMQCLSEILISQCQKYLCGAFDKETGGASPSPTVTFYTSLYGRTVYSRFFARKTGG